VRDEWCGNQRVYRYVSRRGRQSKEKECQDHDKQYIIKSPHNQKKLCVTQKVKQHTFILSNLPSKTFIMTVTNCMRRTVVNMLFFSCESFVVIRGVARTLFLGGPACASLLFGVALNCQKLLLLKLTRGSSGHKQWIELPYDTNNV